MMITSLDQNKKFKIKAKIDKQAQKNADMLHKRLVSERLKYDKLKEAQYTKIDTKYDKKLQHRLNKIQNQYNDRRIKAKKTILGKPVKVKPQDITKMKSLALKSIQLYAKLSRCVWSTKGPQVYLVDKMERVPLTSKVNGGHIFSQRNYPSLAFDIQNIRAITNWTNKQQGDQTANWIVNLPKEVQEYLRTKSEDKSAKNVLRDHKFFEGIIEKYKKLNEAEEIRLGIKVDKTVSNTSS